MLGYLFNNVSIGLETLKMFSFQRFRYEIVGQYPYHSLIGLRGF